LSDRRNHLHEIAKQIEERKSLPDYGYYYGGIKESLLKESENKSILLGTYAYVSEGFDKKGLDTLLLASPKSDVIQVVGRILRDKPEDRINTPLVIDIVDNFSLFINQSKKRLAYYKKCKYNITNEDVNIDSSKSIIPQGYCIIEES
jgi:superfamily II DNA or RNA helicase